MYLYTYTIHFHKCVSSSTRCNGCVDNCRNPSTKPVQYVLRFLEMCQCFVFGSGNRW